MRNTKTKTAYLAIDLGDVRRAGGVPQAILAWSLESDTTGSGYRHTAESSHVAVKPDGWMPSDPTSQARLSFEGGALHYIDPTDGRSVSAEPAEEGDEEAYRDFGGGYFTIGEWSAESEVRIECPDIEDAIEHPAIVAEMAREVIDHHGAESDLAAWKELILAIRGAAEAIEGIDVDDFDAA